jgi:hypothetical protein
MVAVRRFSLRNDDRSSAEKGGTKSPNRYPLQVQLTPRSASVCPASITH